jgi:hypothetical protein
MHGWGDILMLEYVFFHKVLAERFARKAREHKIETTLLEESPAWEVHLPEDIDESIEEKLSDYYDDLFDEDQDMYDEEHQEEDQYDAAAIEITLNNGVKAYAQTDQRIMGKVLSSLTFDEFNRLVEDIVFAVENPDVRTICQRYRDLKDPES